MHHMCGAEQSFKREGPARQMIQFLQRGQTTIVVMTERQRRRRIRFFSREFNMPESRRLRVTIGCTLVVLGFFGFLPVLGFWMIPLGVLVLSYEFALIRRWRRRFVVWWQRTRNARR